MSKRAAIIQLHRAGHSNSKIMKLLKAPKSLRFQELGTMEDRDRSGRPRSARTPVKIKALRERIRRNPKRSLRKTAKDMNISHESVRTIVEQDLKMSPYKIRTRQLLTDLQKRKRKERAKILLNRLKGGTEKGKIVFSDEKLFLVEAKFNTQNDRILGKLPKDLPDHLRFVSHRQKPLSVMVWGAISKSWKSPLIFVKEGVKVNTDSYVNDILTPALASMKEKFKKSPSPSNKTVRLLTHQRRRRSGAKSTFLHSGPKICGHHLCPISILWISVCGVFWKKKPVLHPITIWRIFELP